MFWTVVIVVVTLLGVFQLIPAVFLIFSIWREERRHLPDPETDKILVGYKIVRPHEQGYPLYLETVNYLNLPNSSSTPIVEYEQLRDCSLAIMIEEPYPGCLYVSPAIYSLMQDAKENGSFEEFTKNLSVKKMDYPSFSKFLMEHEDERQRKVASRY